MQPFTIINRITKADFQKMTVKRSYKQPVTKILTVVGVIMLVVAVLSTVDIIPLAQSSKPPVSQFAIALAAFSLPLIVQWQAGKVYDNSPRLHGEVAYTFSDVEIVSIGSNFSNSYSWPTVIKFEEVGDYLMLFTGQNVAEIFRKDTFTIDQLQQIKSKV